jgi:hypothetical protein
MDVGVAMTLMISFHVIDGAVMMVPENLLACSKRPASW